MSHGRPPPSRPLPMSREIFDGFCFHVLPSDSFRLFELITNYGGTFSDDYRPEMPIIWDIEYPLSLLRSSIINLSPRFERSELLSSKYIEACISAGECIDITPYKIPLFEQPQAAQPFFAAQNNYASIPSSSSSSSAAASNDPSPTNLSGQSWLNPSAPLSTQTGAIEEENPQSDLIAQLQNRIATIVQPSNTQDQVQANPDILPYLYQSPNLDDYDEDARAWLRRASDPQSDPGHLGLYEMWPSAAKWQAEVDALYPEKRRPKNHHDPSKCSKSNAYLNRKYRYSLVDRIPPVLPNAPPQTRTEASARFDNFYKVPLGLITVPRAEDPLFKSYMQSEDFCLLIWYVRSIPYCPASKSTRWNWARSHGLLQRSLHSMMERWETVVKKILEGTVPMPVGTFRRMAAESGLFLFRGARIYSHNIVSIKQANNNATSTLDGTMDFENQITDKDHEEVQKKEDELRLEGENDTRGERFKLNTN